MAVRASSAEGAEGPGAGQRGRRLFEEDEDVYGLEGLLQVGQGGGRLLDVGQGQLLHVGQGYVSACCRWVRGCGLLLHPSRVLQVGQGLGAAKATVALL